MSDYPGFQAKRELANLTIEALAEKIRALHPDSTLTAARLAEIEDELFNSTATAKDYMEICDALDLLCVDCREPDHFIQDEGRYFFCNRAVLKIRNTSCRKCGRTQWWRLNKGSRAFKKWRCAACEPPPADSPIIRFPHSQ